MGDIADMILDGTLCELCGIYLGKPCDHPKKCKECKKEEGKDNE
jgi:hypothetical protein